MDPDTGGYANSGIVWIRMPSSFGHRDTAYRILCREDFELAERFSNVIDYGCAYVQGKRTFNLSYKSSPRLLVVNTPLPHENTVKVSQWIRDFILDVDLQRKRASEFFRELIPSVNPEMLPVYDKTMEVTREINRENVEATQEMDETMVATREINKENVEASREMDETMEVEENQMADGGNNIAVGEDQNDMVGGENSIAAGEAENDMVGGKNIIAAGEAKNDMSGGENGIAVYEDQNDMTGGENGIAVYEDQNDMTAGENVTGWENLFQLMNESTFKGYFNNETGFG
ncbi:hypothetical protein TNCV_1906121 [Trichonephila clavipes]|nr:hypothetical protein TNCV_1906121 [Trichonephila clavipes]